VIQLLRLTVPDCTILATSSPKHHNHITALGADSALDRNAASLAKDAKSATKQSQGVDAIIDAVGAASTQRHILEAFDSSGPKRFAQVWTGGAGIEVPGGVDSTMFRVSALAQMQGRRNAMSALQALPTGGLLH
jgi:NADPH:quinone reductase-like Zn-dependent oxidoreductase